MWRLFDSLNHIILEVPGTLVGTTGNFIYTEPIFVLWLNQVHGVSFCGQKNLGRDEKDDIGNKESVMSRTKESAAHWFSSYGT